MEAFDQWWIFSVIFTLFLRVHNLTEASKEFSPHNDRFSFYTVSTKPSWTRSNPPFQRVEKIYTETAKNWCSFPSRPQPYRKCNECFNVFIASACAQPPATSTAATLSLATPAAPQQAGTTHAAPLNATFRQRQAVGWLLFPLSSQTEATQSLSNSTFP